ncbi:hypothetical protein CKO13_01415 [Halorhodospira neutriphila]|uniref:Uncharacterized protein n=1 Tax=Halorhodospira neutriphila TaxID=168379 RepID=A0ABS1E4D9_9GAMM|nr:hypothetical protein [Halorhodospira neutriphila]
MAHAEQQRLRTGQSHEEWAEAVDAAYCRLVPRGHRSLPAPDLQHVEGADEWRKLLRAWDQQIRRYVAGERHWPAELEEAWVEALDEPYRSECRRELAQRLGCYGAIRRPGGQEGDGESWAAILDDFSSITQDMATIMADSRMDSGDDLEGLIRDIDRMEADLVAMRERAREIARHGPALQSVS